MLSRTSHLLMSCWIFVILAVAMIHGSAVAAPQSEISLAYKAQAGDLLSYQSSRTDTRATEREGETTEFTTTRIFDFDLQAEHADSLLSFVLTVKKLEITMEGARGGRGFPPLDPKVLEGKRLRIKITPAGEQRDISAIDSIPMPERPERADDRPMRGRFGNPLNQVRINFIQLPTRRVKVGDTWTEPFKDMDGGAAGFFGRMIQDQKITGTTKYTVIGEEQKNGFKCLHLRIESNYSRSFESQRQGNRISGESEGETKADVWFAPKEGLLVEYSLNDFNEGSTAFSGRTVPNSNESKVTLKLVSWKPKK
ncbi:MAG: hypothetical protein ONB31_14295 [candidate division KSB1 bacterium]|nr:hypothetical protein [candidate division KSB1 bacterium]MDZ7335702.1 hypothetical protein [candidate division KSB1 bacterium]MDZ7358362.1 hypothetical protein [candidate division KSB1 bacterium]MDZ7401953.1 hypothetical protein [candidate division KSB1 bacterium]